MSLGSPVNHESWIGRPRLSTVAIGGTGFQPVRQHRQDAGATKNFQGCGLNQSLNGVNLDLLLAALADLTLLP